MAMVKYYYIATVAMVGECEEDKLPEITGGADYDSLGETVCDGDLNELVKSAVQDYVSVLPGCDEIRVEQLYADTFLFDEREQFHMDTLLSDEYER